MKDICKHDFQTWQTPICHADKVELHSLVEDGTLTLTFRTSFGVREQLLVYAFRSVVAYNRHVNRTMALARVLERSSIASGSVQVEERLQCAVRAYKTLDKTCRFLIVADNCIVEVDSFQEPVVAELAIGANADTHKASEQSASELGELLRKMSNEIDGKPIAQ